MKKLLTFIILLGIMITLMIPKITTRAYSTENAIAYITIPFTIEIYNQDGILSSMDMSIHNITPQQNYGNDIIRHNNGASAIQFDYYAEPPQTSGIFNVNYRYRYEYGWDTDFDLTLDNVTEFSLIFNDLVLNKDEFYYYMPAFELRYDITYEIYAYYLDAEFTIKEVWLTGSFNSTNFYDETMINQLFYHTNDENVYIHDAKFTIEPSYGWEEFAPVSSINMYIPVYDTLYQGNSYNRPFSTLYFLENYNYELPEFDGGSWLATAVGGFLNTPIFGFVSIGSLLLTIIAIPLVIALLKFFAGG